MCQNAVNISSQDGHFRVALHIFLMTLSKDFDYNDVRCFTFDEWNAHLSVGVEFLMVISRDIVFRSDF